MKRTDLIALAEAFEEMARGTRCLVKYPGDAPDRTAKELDAGALLMRQIAQAQPVGYLLKTGHGNRFAETIPADPLELTWAGKPAWSAVYTLPLED